MPYSITTKDGITIQGIPDEMPADAPELKQRVATIRAQMAGPSLGSQIAGGVRDLAAGALRGAGSIGATVLAPLDMARDALDGKGLSLQSNRERRQAMDDALRTMGADTESTAYGVGKVGSEIAGTLGVGGAVANGLARVPGLATVAAPAIDAVRTAGMSAGGVGGWGGQAIRAAGGAVNGAAAAGLVNPSDVGTGAAVGAVMPAAVQGIAKAGGAAADAVRAAVRSQAARTGGEIGRALELNTPDAVQQAITALRAGGQLVPGSTPTAAQVLQTPQAGILERVVSDTRGGAALKDAYAAQNAARLAALEGVAPTAPAGYATARADTGTAIERFARQGDAAAKARTSALYEAVPQDEAAVYLPDLAAVRDRYFGAGSFVDRAPADRAVAEARRIGTLEVPAGAATTAGPAPRTLAQAVRQAGGLSLTDHGGLLGEVRGLQGDLKNLVRRSGGVNPNTMAERMHEAGMIPNEDVSTLFAALRDEAIGVPQYGVGADIERTMRAAAEAAAGGAPIGSVVPQKVTLREFDNLRQSIGIEQRAAARAGNDKLARSLADMKAAMDDRINQVVRGDGAIDENLPIEWANMLDAARKSKADQVAQFRTGPQAAMFRKGADGQPLKQGGEVASLFWGNRPGLAEDVQSLRKLIDDNPALLGQFRSMVTTEGASTANAGGNLGIKFARWVDAMRPGLERAFEPGQVDMLSRIAQDIRRAESAAAAGMSKGSNTYQNANNALKLGLLDSSAAKLAVDRIPFGGAGIDWLRNTMRDSKASRLAQALADANAAADALATGGVRPPGAVSQLLANPQLQGLFYRAPAPALADRQGR